MDEMAAVLLLALLGLCLAAGMIVYLHNKLRDKQVLVAMPTSRDAVLGIRKASYTVTPRGVRPSAESREDIDECIARIFTKRAVSDRYSGVSIDGIPGAVLRQLDEIIEKSVYIKHTHNIISKIDALEDNFEELVGLVATDPLLSATVMRQANSAYFGAKAEVTSLKFAIELLGISNLKNLVYREYVLREHRGKSIADQALFSNIWEHALLSATAAAYLALLFPGMEPAKAYTVALLHDIGKFLLMSSGLIELDQNRCLRPYSGGFSRDTALIWRYDHALVGKVAAMKWEFGAEVADAIGMHHYSELVNLHKIRADKGTLQLLTLTHLANQVAKFFSREPRAANYLVPLHFSFHQLVDPGAVRAVLSESNLLADLSKIKAGTVREGTEGFC